MNPWIDNTGINTLINFFEGWDKDSIAHIYTKEKLPNTRVCETFFRISEPRVLKSVFGRTLTTGEIVVNSNVDVTDDSPKERIYAKKKSAWTAMLREFVWVFGKWRSKALTQFLDEYDAEVLFFPIYSTIYMNRLQNYIRKHTNKPVILYVSDDNYSYKSVRKTPFALLHRFWLRSQEKKLFKTASKIMVISPKQKEEYDALFGVDSIIMTKGLDFSGDPTVNAELMTPIKMVYTGKLIIGRWLSLTKIADALGAINQDGIKAELDIYTTDDLTVEQEQALNRNGCSVKGALSLDEVKKVQEEADILVFVESLEKQFRYAARLSFSTKITDYLRSGKCIFAIGDREIAPIDYFQRYDSAITATTYEEIGEKLGFLLSHKELILEYGKKAYRCGKEHHSIELMNRTLKYAICESLNKKTLNEAEE